MDDLIYLDAQELTRGYIRREFSPREVVTALIARRRELDPLLNAFAGCNDEMANEDADRATRHYRAQRNPPPLCGVPVGVKDLIDTRATRTSYGSRLFADHVPEKDAKVVAMMRAASMPMIGKTTTHEFAWGITCESEHYGPCRNPWDTSRIPGGSSGGSAVAVATGQACVALGTDTAGSVRIPAAFCGVVGLKPTFGLLSTSGVFPLAPSLDHIGVLTRTPRDAQTLFTTLVGQKTRLAGVLLQQPAKLAGLRVRVMDVSGAPVPEESISACVRGAADVLRDLGAVVEVERVTFADDPALTLGRVQSVEAFATHARRGLYPAHQAEYEDDVRGRLEAAAVVGLDDYLDGLEASRRIRAELEDLFERCDLLLSPVSAAVPPRIGDTAALRRLVLPFTSIQSIGGLPTCVVRAGFDPQGLPIGVQLAGPRLSDHLVLEVACAFYEATPEVQTRWPTMTGVRPRVDERPVQGAGVASG